MNNATLIEKFQEDISWLGYNETEREIIEHIKCAMTLLKAQEPQSVIVREKPKNGNILWFADCPKCKHGIERDKHKRFCGYCGQAVKWE